MRKETPMEQYIVTGMSCAACQARVEKAVGKVPGVSSVSVSLLRQLNVQFLYVSYQHLEYTVSFEYGLTYKNEFCTLDSVGR